MISLTLPFPPTVNHGAGVYRITDGKTGRFYIGSSADIFKRWRQHVYRLTRGDHPNPILQQIWNADPARLSISIVKQVIPSRDELLRAEQIALNVAGVGDNRGCMNVLRIAGSHLGRKRSEATVAKLREVNRGRSSSVEVRAKMRAAKIGRRLSAEHRANIGNAVRGKSITRPLGIINHKLRMFSNSEIMEMRALRNSGISWRLLAARYAGDFSVVRRAALGITYKDVR